MCLCYFGFIHRSVGVNCRNCIAKQSNVAFSSCEAVFLHFISEIHMRNTAYRQHIVTKMLNLRQINTPIGSEFQFFQCSKLLIKSTLLDIFAFLLKKNLHTRWKQKLSKVHYIKIYTKFPCI